MKKGFVLIVGILVLLVSFSTFAETLNIPFEEVTGFRPEPQDVTWVKIPKNGTIHRIVYRSSDKKCEVSVRRGDGGVEIRANDWDYKTQTLFTQDVWIKDGKIVENKISATQNTLEEVSGAYDIFYVKYRQAAQKLPPRVKELFNRHWGVNNDQE